MKKALITGITGQDGSYLAAFLIKKGYEVHGLKRPTSLLNTDRIDHLYREPQELESPLVLHYGDLTDSLSLLKVIKAVQPDEIYNLAAQSHVAVSFDEPVYTANADGVGVLRILESLRILGLEATTKFYQASTSELYGLATNIPQSETTPFHPRSPYAIAKLYAHWTVINYREAYGMFACNGILFNHESPVRGETFVTRKISRGLARIKVGLQDCLYLGNLDAQRDWGHAKDYVEMQWMMLQQETPQDFVIATGIQSSVREFTTLAAAALDLDLRWEGQGESETGVLYESATDGRKSCRTIVRIDPRYIRPSEVDSLLGDASKAQEFLGWKPRTSLKDLVHEMVEADLAQAKLEMLAMGRSHQTSN